MGLNRFFTGLVAGILALTVSVTDVLATSDLAAANTPDTPSIMLNGTVEEGQPGYLTSKLVMLSSGSETRVNYRVVPGYSTGQASGVRVSLFMPSLEHVDGEYRVVSRDAEPTPMGIEGRVSAGGDWIIISDTVSKGGPLVLEYDGDLRPGVNPAFDIFVKTYNDGTDGPYGSVPEGTPFEINGFISYEAFNQQDGTGWSTPGLLDDDSRVSVISSDLQWEPTIEAHVADGGSPTVPMWDRYQYLDYMYTLENVSTNAASNIDGYSVTFDIDTTDNINGIIPSDLNKFIFGEGGTVVPNDDPTLTEGQFIGVPGEGGVLIYDVTDWDGEAELTNPIPYSYSGAGMIVIDREHGDDKQGLAPGEQRKFLVSLPMSRQGFPNLPTNFKVVAITNVLFAKTANWTKTRTVMREVVNPTYGFDFTHKPEQQNPVYGVETYTEMSGFKNTSNAPVFNPFITYTVPEKFSADRVVFEFTPDQLERFKDVGVSYVAFNEKDQTETLVPLSGVVGNADATADGNNTVTFDVSKMPKDWNRKLVFSDIVKKMNPNALLPLEIRVYGKPLDNIKMVAPAVVTYIERYANNEDFTQETTYAEFEHTVQKDAAFTVVLPKELNPSVEVVGIYGDRRTIGTTQISYEAPMQAEYQLTTRDVTSPEFTYTIDMLDPTKPAGELLEKKIVLSDEMLAAAKDVKITFVDKDGNEVVITERELDIADVELDNIAKIVISGTDLNLPTLVTIATVDYDSELDMGSKQTLRGTFEGTQNPPYTEKKKATKNNVVEVREAKTTTEVEGLNQPTKGAGAGNSYDQWVDRHWYCNTSGCGSKTDYTLDQGYKSLGGFATTITRPTAVYDNNDQTTKIDVEFPHEQFDMYYMKIRDDLKPFIQSIDIYRMVDGEEVLWKTVDGSEWVANTTEGNFWRIATAQPGMADEDLFKTQDAADAAGHPYYKEPFAGDVVPERPVSKVSVTLKFEREGANEAPQLKGTTSRAIEYMGRFYDVSEEGRKATAQISADTIGVENPITRAHSASPIYSNVSYPFAQSRTGAEDSTNTAKKVIPLGQEGHYLSSIWNVNSASWYVFNGHGPDVYSPNWTEFDEWLYHYDPSSFHDQFSYEFVYPANPKTNADYNFEVTDIELKNTSTLQYLTEFRVDYKNGKTDESVTLTIDEALREELLAQPQMTIVYDNTMAPGFHHTGTGTFAVSLGEGNYPTKFEATFEQVNGFGDNTAELQGVAGDNLGTNLNEIDVQVGGIVNGNKDLVGTTNLYREPNGSERQFMHTSKATLTGYTPKLGASMDMKFDALSVYDYDVDGITSNITTAEAGMRNASEADISGFTMTVKPDAAMRSEKLEIPAEIFNEQWETKAVSILVGKESFEIDLAMFKLNEATGRYWLDIRALFDDGTLPSRDQKVTFGGASTLVIREVTSVSVEFASKLDENGKPATRMWGSLARDRDATLPDRMIDGSYVFITGDWVDETAKGPGLDSKPSFRNEGTKVDSGTGRYTTFVASAADIKTPQRFTTPNSGSNSNTTPTYTANYSNAPYLRHRVASLDLLGMHLNDDLTQASGSLYPFDEDTNAQVARNDLVVGDTTKVLYELRNGAKVGSGLNPVFNPSGHFTAPDGLDITDLQVIGENSPAVLKQLIADAGKTLIEANDENVTITDGKNAQKLKNVVFNDIVLSEQQSVFVLVEYTAVNDYSDKLGDTQGKTVRPYSYARPAFQHHIQNYVVQGVDGDGVNGNGSVTGNYDGDNVDEALARVSTEYRYANPTALTVKSKFDKETISRESMTLVIDEMGNQIRHDNTAAVLDITLDTKADGFELTKMPKPEYPAGFVGEFDEPQVYILVGNDWVTYDADKHELADVSKLRVDYGIVPAFADANGTALTFPAIEIVGIGHWQNYGGATTKSSQITTQATLTLTHHDGSTEGNPAVASYQVTANASSTVYKPLPVVEFNVQSFDTRAEAEELYTDVTAAAPGKVSYEPGDPVYVKLTARNADTATGTQTGAGKAPLLEPVIFDKVPEYITTGLENFISDGTLDVAAAVAADDLVINHYDSKGELIEGATLPKVTVEVKSGKDVGGDQTFKNDRRNDAYGLLSSKEPFETDVNPAREIKFQIFTYNFEDNLDRGERIEIVYSGEIRKGKLPYAKYAKYAKYPEDAVERTVYAPLLGWYTGNVPLASNAHKYDMDMAALLHDAGISGTRDADVTAAEFLATSAAWQPGSTDTRRNPKSSSAHLDTYYDASANSMYSHKAFMQERADNTLFEAATGSTGDDNFRFVNTARVNDGAVSHHERIMWAQDSLQLTRAWLYGASEMIPETEREAPSGLSDANFYEHDGSLEAPYYVSGYTADNYTYAVQLHEEFTVRLHAANLGDRSIKSGIEYLEVLPEGISPMFDENGEVTGVKAFDGAGNEIDPARVTVEVVQTPQSPAGYEAPAQSQEAGTYQDVTIKDTVPYVLKVQVAGELGGMFQAESSTLQSKYQYVEIDVRVDGDAPTIVGDKRYWHDELTVTTIAPESYLEVYSKEYGAFNVAANSTNPAKFPNDGIEPGVDITDLRYSYGSYSSYYSFEPYGMYIRGLNAQNTHTSVDGKPAVVTGDQLAMRAASLRVWNDVEKDDYKAGYPQSVQDFTVELNEQFTIHATSENQQVETSTDYAVGSGAFSKFYNQTQTTGGARGSWFDPAVTVVLPYGIVPVLEDGKLARYRGEVAEQQDVKFTATVNNVTYKSSDVAADVTEHLDLRVERIKGDEGERFVLYFTMKNNAAAKAALHEVKFGQALVVSPRVAVIDVPAYGKNVGEINDQEKYQEIITLAHSERDVFEPVLTPRYKTGSTPEGTTVDRARLDSTGTLGALKITERLIAANELFSYGDQIALHKNGNWNVDASELLADQVPASESNEGVKGGTQLAIRQPTIVNSTKVGPYADGPMSEVFLADAAGRFWVSTQIDNRPAANDDPYERIKDAGDVLNSRFLVTTQLTSFAEKTQEVRLVVDGVVLDRAEFEALGYTVEAVTSDERDSGEERQSVQWLITTPAAKNGTEGRLATGSSMSLVHQYELVDGFTDDEFENKEPWNDPSLDIDAYVSLISDDLALITGSQNEKDFIVQPTGAMHYETKVVEAEGSEDIDLDRKHETFFAHNDARIEIAKPSGEVRVNTTRPRLEYSNGLTGDTYFNSADTIEYLTTLAKNTGSGLKEMVVEHILPTHESNDDSIELSKDPLTTTLLYVTSGKWELPAETLERIEAMDKEITDVFETEVFISAEFAENGYEGGEWVSLGKSDITKNTMFEIPADLKLGQHKVRVVVRSLDADFLVPNGTRLAVDADPEAPGSQEVSDTDPENKSVTKYPAEVTDNAVKIGMRATSDRKATQFIWDTAQLWGNYVADAHLKLDQSDARAYLTPSRPVVNVFHDALYYRSDASKPQNERYGWSENTAIKPDVSPHLKFRGELVNADETMWDVDTEGDTYSEDTLINPTMSFELPAVMTVSDNFTYVPNSQVDAGHPLSDDHRTRYPLTDDSAYMWTWKLVRADGTEASKDSYLDHTRIHTGAWNGMDRNVVTVWFEGQVFPGDKIVVDFIGKIDSYTPGAASDDLQSRVYATNNTGLVQPLNSMLNNGNRLGYTTDRFDLDDNRLLNDRLVFAERTLFEYETYDNFGKRKVSYSDLNKAGTVWPQITPVREGGEFNFQVSLDNTKEAVDTPYPYPIMYDVLPFEGDTSIMNENVPRNSKQSALLDLDSIKLSVEGTENREYKQSEYTVYVGPLKKQGGQIVPADMVKHADAGSEAFFDSLGMPGKASAVRDAHFVTLPEFKAAVAHDSALLEQARTLLVMFNNASTSLPGQSKLKLDYDMQVPLNAPAFIETWNTENTPSDYAQWNSFVGTQRKANFKPQESNNAGVYVTERVGSVSIGNYVWNDANFNAKQDEGEQFVDGNGRTLLRPSMDINFDGVIDDPGINGVKVTLLTPNGNLVDVRGNPIVQSGEEWVVIDDKTGEIREDDLGQTTSSEGPLVTTTLTDANGFAGYYVFSNIEPGEYRVMFEFPSEYERFGVTTREVLSGAGVEVFEPGEEAGIPAGDNKDALVAITAADKVSEKTSDDVRMGFDLGVAEMIDFGGKVWNDENRNGTIDAGEAGFEGYNVFLQDMDGKQVLDENGNPFATKTEADGSYVFTLLPRERQYQVQVTHPSGEYDTGVPVTPIMHSHDPFELVDDNDGFLTKNGDERIVKTNPVQFDLEGLYASAFEERLSVNVGFYNRQETAVIGNRVWDDLNRDGIQDANEPGIAGQELILEQFEQVDSKWVKNEDFTASVTSGADGYYFFRDVPVFREVGDDLIDLRYQVVARKGGLVEGYTFSPAHQGANQDLDSDFFFETGTMQPSAKVENLISLVEDEDGEKVAVDNITVDLGLMTHDTGEIAGEIFIDGAADGIKVEDKRGAERFTVTVQRSLDGVTWVDHAAVSTVNAYSFKDLPVIDNATRQPVQYRVVVSEVPLWFVITDRNVGEDDSIDSDFVEAGRDGTYTAVSDTYVLGELLQGQFFPIDTRESVDQVNIDLGLVKPVSVIGGKMWDDANANGIQDVGEKPIAGKAITLWERVDGEWTKALAPQLNFPAMIGAELNDRAVTDTTDANGEYRFEVSPLHYEDETADNFLAPRLYRVTVERGAGQEWSPLNVGDDRTVDSDVITPATEFGNQMTGVTDVFSILDHENDIADPTTKRDDVQMDIGVTQYRTEVVIGGRVWEDADLDGIQTEGEASIAEQWVTLWEKIDGEWVVAEDLNGDSTLATGADGRYEFTVAPTHYEEGHPLFLQPREYRVTSDRLGNQVWSPAVMGDDHTVDSNVRGSGEAPVLRGYSDDFVVIDVVDGQVDVSTTRDDVEMDMGVKTYADFVSIGGTAWVDSNEDGEEQKSEEVLGGREVTLWEKVDGAWVVSEDIYGVSVRDTDESGFYEFVVSPTHFSEEAEGFMKAREYRTTMELPEGYRLSSAESVTTWLHDNDATTVTAEFVAVDEEGKVILTELTDDHELDYPFVVIPKEGLAFTGGQAAALGLIGALGAGFLGLLLMFWGRRRKSENEELEV